MPRDDDGDDCKRSSKACESKGDDDYVTAVLVVFELPDGSEGEKHFKMGHTVEVLKSFVEEEFEIPMGVQSLYLDETLMLDPLSLSDYPAIDPARDCFVRVGGEIPEQAQKK
ncbi:hypothetical protein JL722_13603 [Aureococcus anophagefferens]|nr:hypothetical protein JL722_13603 [Aureococcus anophagefferens]